MFPNTHMITFAHMNMLMIYITTQESNDTRFPRVSHSCATLPSLFPIGSAKWNLYDLNWTTWHPFWTDCL